MSAEIAYLDSPANLKKVNFKINRKYLVHSNYQMQRKSSYTNTKKYCSLMQTAMSYCIAIVFSFSIIWVQASALANTIPKNNIVYNDINKSNDLVKYSSAPIHPVPVETLLASSETENSQEDESKDDSKDRTSSLGSNFSYESNIIISSEKSLFHQLALAIQNRTTVSLFILHHSWKSFLS